MLLLGKSKITSKGQVTLPVSVREENGVSDKHSALFYKNNDGEIVVEIQSNEEVSGYHWEEYVFNLLKDLMECNPVVAVIGGSGVGKTVFVEEFIEHQELKRKVNVFDVDEISEEEFIRYVENKDYPDQAIWVSQQLSEESLRVLGDNFIVVEIERMQSDFYASFKRHATITRWKSIDGEGYMKTPLLHVYSRK